jgi:hypothetical protein
LAFLVVAAVIVVVTAVACWLCYQAVMAEAYARYVGIKNVSAENIARTIRGVEMSAKNVFAEVGEHVSTPEDVIGALESKANFNLDVKGYFAAFAPNYFPEKGTWFEPYIYQPDGRGFEYKQVGSARHNYMKSPWFIRAQKSRASFWSEPYYYYDGTSLSGHYSTYVKPIYDAEGELVCVCGADVSFEWLSREMAWVDEVSRRNNMLNKYHLAEKIDFYTIILDKDGTCVAHPEEKAVTITDSKVINDFVEKKSGVTDMNINGVACTIYYGPIDYVDWVVAVVVPRSDVLKPLIRPGILLLSVAFIGILIAWFIIRKTHVQSSMLNVQ